MHWQMIAFGNKNASEKSIIFINFCICYTYTYLLTLQREQVRGAVHCWYIEPRNKEKSLRLIWQGFSCLLDEWIAKISKKKISRWLFEIIHIICFQIWDLRSRDLKIFLGYDINYLSIWPFMHHPWFPTRKASKLIFVCFQLAGEWHHPASWKQANVSFEAFLVGNQGWPIKGQMLR